MQRRRSQQSARPSAAAASTPPLRVLSLLPSASDMVRSLGGSHLLIGRSHECDWPELQHLPPATSDKLGAMEPGELDAAMTAGSGGLCWWAAGGEGCGPALLDQGLSPYRTDVNALLDLKPDVILTQMQGLCPDLTPHHYSAALHQLLGSTPRVVQLAAGDLAGVWSDMEGVGEALGLGQGATSAMPDLQRRLDAAASAARGRPRPRVAVIQWTDPLFAAGGWVPQLVELAGGRDVLGGRGEAAEAFTGQELADAQPDIIIFALCGFNLTASRRLARTALDALAAPPPAASTTAAASSGPNAAATAVSAAVRGAGTTAAVAVSAVFDKPVAATAVAAALHRARLVVVDGVRVFSRPGPLLVDSLEVLVEVLHGEAQRYGHEGGLWENVEWGPQQQEQQLGVKAGCA